MAPKLRVLALHSFRTSANIFKKQVANGLGSSLDDLLDIVYIDAPHAATGPAPADVAGVFDPPYYEWWSVEKDERGRYTYEGSQKTMEYVVSYLEQHGPFDGVMAFSQGGAVASLLLGMTHHAALPKDVPPLKFGIIFAGIRSRDVHFRRYLDGGISVPVVHVIGDTDYVKEYAYQLVDCFSQPLLITHPRGHVIPKLTDGKLQQLRSFLQHMHQHTNSKL